MAAGGRIVALLIVLCALLPLLAYAAHPSIDDGFNSLSIPTDKVDSLDSLENEEEDNDDVSKDNKERHIKSVMRAQNLDNKKDKKKKEPKPVKKVGPEEPVKPTKPAKPVQPVNPAKPAQPVNPAKPVQPVNPVNTVGPAPGVLREGFYQQTCPQAEKIIQDTMDKIFEKNVKVAPALVRLFFHDCFVTGCDASILLEKTPSGEKTEREAPQNGAFVRGFEEIEEIKAALEAACPGVVSCADTLAFAARESLVQNGLPRYPVAAGRRDRPVSLSANAERDLPFPDTPAQEMVQMFERKGMTIDDLVVLIGAHSIGEAHCTVYEGRFRDPEKRKDINPQYLDQLHVQSFCVDQDQTLPFDRMSQNIMDAGFYKQLLAHETLIESDHNLAVAPNTNAIMKRYADDQVGWTTRFIQAINKLGGLEVLTGDQGEIRKQCRAFN